MPPLLYRLLGILSIAHAGMAADLVPGRYLVEIEAEPAIASGLAAVRKGFRAGAGTGAVRTRLEARQIRVLRSIDTVASVLVVEMDENQAREAANVAGVRRLQPVRYLRVNLDRAVELQRVSAAFQKLGGMDRAGAGVKIGIIDTGIDPMQPGFEDPSLSIPDGFPKIDKEADRQYTTNKVIAARSYDGPAGSPLDQNGHGTAVAMVAAGVMVAGPRGLLPDASQGRFTCDRCLVGVAPKAWLGNYRVNKGTTGQIPTDNILQAMNDAVQDGMDVLNFSFGSVGLTAVRNDILAQAIERLAKSGVIVVQSAGNSGPDVVTVDGAAASPWMIAAGSSDNDRFLTSPAVVAGQATYSAVPGSNTYQAAPVTGPLFDVAAVDPSGLACGPMPPDSLKGFIAFIFRGTCPFEDKINNAAQAGAVAALIYTQSTQPDPITMAAGSATLPATMLSFADGNSLKTRLSAGETVRATLRFWAVPQQWQAVSGFSSRGPSVEYNIKPDLLAIGGDVVTGTQTNNPQGDLYSRSGWVQVSGTSFSAPMLAGAVAVLKGARPGLDPQVIRSLLIHSASPMLSADGKAALVQQAGTGILNLAAALDATAAADPLSLSFGVQPDGLSRDLTIRNAGPAPDTFTLSIESDDAALPHLSQTLLSLAPGASQTVQVLRPDIKAPGQYQGFVTIRAANTAVVSRVAYWWAVAGGPPAAIAVAINPGTAKPAASVDVYFRVVDSAGISLPSPVPQVTVASGGGTVISVDTLGSIYPGVWIATVKLGSANGANLFRLTAGELARDLSITATTSGN